MNNTAKWLMGAVLFGGTALLGNLAPRLLGDDSLSRELNAQRAMLTALSKKLDARSPPPPGSSTTVIGAACDPSLLAPQVQASVRDALDADRKDAADEKKERSISPDSAQIYAKADAWVSNKMHSKVWSPSDFGRLDAMSIGLPKEQRLELRHRVLREINSGDFEIGRMN